MGPHGTLRESCEKGVHDRKLQKSRWRGKHGRMRKWCQGRTGEQTKRWGEAEAETSERRSHKGSEEKLESQGWRSRELSFYQDGCPQSRWVDTFSMAVRKYRSLDVSQCGIRGTCGMAVLKELGHFRTAHREQRNFLI